MAQACPMTKLLTGQRDQLAKKRDEEMFTLSVEGLSHTQHNVNFQRFKQVNS